MRVKVWSVLLVAGLVIGFGAGVAIRTLVRAGDESCVELRVIDAHNHDAAYAGRMLWEEDALDTFPNTVIIFGHANAYNSPDSIAPLLEKHPNLVIDFFAGFDAHNSGSSHSLADYVPLIEQYSDRVVFSTDSGYDIGYEPAVTALYDLLDLLTPEAACNVSHETFARLMDGQPPTQTQLARLVELDPDTDYVLLNKRLAHALILELEAVE